MTPDRPSAAATQAQAMTRVSTRAPAIRAPWTRAPTTRAPTTPAPTTPAAVTRTPATSEGLLAERSDAVEVAVRAVDQRLKTRVLVGRPVGLEFLCRGVAARARRAPGDLLEGEGLPDALRSGLDGVPDPVVLRLLP